MDSTISTNNLPNNYYVTTTIGTNIMGNSINTSIPDYDYTLSGNIIDTKTVFDQSLKFQNQHNLQKVKIDWKSIKTFDELKEVLKRLDVFLNIKISIDHIKGIEKHCTADLNQFQDPKDITMLKKQGLRFVNENAEV